MGLFGLFSSTDKKTKKAKSSKKKRAGTSIQSVISTVEVGEIKRVLPELTGKIVLEVSPQLSSLGYLLKEKGAKLVAGIGMNEGFAIKSRVESLPLLDNSCDFLLYRVFEVKRELSRVIQEAGRVLKGGGTLLLADLHPFSLAAQEAYRLSPVTEEGLPPGFERYFKFFQMANLELERIKEVFVDGSIKKHFGEKQKGEFDRLRKTPLMVLMTLRKGK